MERIVTGAQAKAFDRVKIEAGASSLAMMQTAAQGIADAVLSLRKADEPVAAICGVGNNGGDGVCAAWLLQQRGVAARIVLVGDESKCTPDTAFYLKKAREAGISAADDLKLNGDEILIDALFGVGLTRPVEGVYRMWIERMNASGRPIVSADIPSGLDADTL